jgi:hypothetical protein
VASPLALLLLGLAIGGAAAHHSGHLSDYSVSPREVAAGDAVALAITYTDAGAAAPRSLVAQIGDVRKSMTAGSDDFAGGVRYTASLIPAAGWHDVYFRATDSEGRDEVVSAGRVHAKSPDPAPPTPAPTPTPKPEPAPTATPKPSPTPIVGTGGGRGSTGEGDGSGSGSAAPTAGPTAGPTPGGDGPAPGTGNATPAPGGPSSSPVAATFPPPAAATAPALGAQDPSDSTDSAAPPPTGTAEQTPAAGSDPGAALGAAVMAGTGSATGQGTGKGSGQTEGAIAGGSEPTSEALFARSRHATLTTLLRELAPTIATATAGGTAWAAFVIFGKRRRDGDEPEPESLVAASAGAGIDMAAAQGLRAVDESQMPRWRRPSLQQVRKADPLRAVAETARLSFEASGVRPLESYERRQIRYRLVRLLDCPDEVRASETGILDRGDEVQLLERHGVYWRVLCPDGRTGWVHRMTLGDPNQGSVIEEAPAPAPYEAPDLEAFEGCPADEPAAELAPADDSDKAVDGLLEAYMRARGDLVRPTEQAGPIERSEPAGQASAEAVAELAPEQVEPVVAEPTTTPAAEAPAAALARDYLARAGFAVRGPATALEAAVEEVLEPAVEPAVEATVEPAVEPEPAPAVSAAADSPSSDASPAAESEHAGGKYSGRKSAGSRKAASVSRPGTKSRRPSR